MILYNINCLLILNYVFIPLLISFDLSIKLYFFNHKTVIPYTEIKIDNGEKFLITIHSRNI